MAVNKREPKPIEFNFTNFITIVGMAIFGPRDFWQLDYREVEFRINEESRWLNDGGK